jgi:hypothetical protein
MVSSFGLGGIEGRMMNHDQIVDSILLQAGYHPRDILIAHYKLQAASKAAAEGSASRVAAERLASMPWAFLYDLATAAKVSLMNLIKLFKNGKVVKFFSLMKWSMDKLFAMVKTGWKAWKGLQGVISEYLANTRIGQWTKEELAKLDAWLIKHPLVKKIGGPILAGLLLYLWFNMAFTGDPAFDFDMSDILMALSGGYSLVEMFAGPEGMKFLLAVVVGAGIGLSFPWPGPTSIQFVLAIISTLSKKVGVLVKRLSPEKIDEQAQSLIPV